MISFFGRAGLCSSGCVVRRTEGVAGVEGRDEDACEEVLADVDLGSSFGTLTLERVSLKIEAGELRGCRTAAPRRGWRAAAVFETELIFCTGGAGELIGFCAQAAARGRAAITKS